MGDYLQPAFLRALRGQKVKSIFEFGCGDGEDTLRLRNRFGAVVYAFECNPFMLPVVRARSLTASSAFNLSRARCRTRTDASRSIR